MGGDATKAENMHVIEFQAKGVSLNFTIHETLAASPLLNIWQPTVLCSEYLCFVNIYLY